LVLVLIAGLLSFFNYPVAHAAGITAVSDTMSRDKISIASSHTMKFTTTSAIQTAGDTITITFPSDFNFTSKTISTVTFTHGASTGIENTETLAGSPTASAWGAVFSGTQNRVFTLTAPTDGIGAAAVAASDKLIITYDNTNSINASATTGQIVTIAVAGSSTESGSFAISLITEDQVVVSTTIDPYITFILTTTSVTLTKSGGGNPNYNTGGTGYNQGSANTLAATTNATTGYSISYNGATLTDASAHTIDAMATKTTSAVNTEQFGINLKINTTPATGTDPSGGSGAPTSDYNTANNFRFIAGATTALASSGSSSTTSTFTVTYIANVAQTTEAGAYSTTITYICTGNF
jgi:hypothetical protein